MPGDSTGKTVAGHNGEGFAENQLNHPISIYVDKDENIISLIILIHEYKNGRKMTHLVQQLQVAQ